MANDLSEEKKEQVLALGRLGWPLRQIQKATRIRRETASQYLKSGWDCCAPAFGFYVTTMTASSTGKPSVSGSLSAWAK